MSTAKNTQRHDLYGYAIGILIAELAGVLAQLFAGPSGGFYDMLIMPPLSPPGWVFPAVWTLLYALMGIASYRIYKSISPGRAAALFLYGAQLVVNFLWPLVFFRFHAIGPSIAVMLVLLALAVLTTVFFFRIERSAGWLMVPYVLWLLFAAYLNIAIYFLNA